MCLSSPGGAAIGSAARSMETCSKRLTGQERACIIGSGGDILLNHFCADDTIDVAICRPLSCPAARGVVRH